MPDGRCVVAAREQSRVVDLRDALREQLDGARREIALLIAVER